MPHGSLSLVHVDGPPCYAWHSSFHPGKNSVRPTSHLLRMFHIQNSVRRHPTFSGCLTSKIMSGRRSTFSGYLTSGILSGQRSTFSGYFTSRILSGRHCTFSGYFTSGSDVGWERRAIQLPRSDMSGSFDSAYPESIQPTIQIPRTAWLVRYSWFVESISARNLLLLLILIGMDVFFHNSGVMESVILIHAK